MLIVTERLQERRAPQERLVLPFEQRQKSRLRTRLESGVEVGLFLDRGIVLRGGDLLLADGGTVIEVVAAAERVSTVMSTQPLQLARAGYHLGNRHVPVQIGSGWLRYRHDHVLDDMVRGLGLSVTVEQAPFEPEAGAYSHSHGSGQPHDHDYEASTTYRRDWVRNPAHSHGGEAGHTHSHEPGVSTAGPSRSHEHSSGSTTEESPPARQGHSHD
jgi:urease accessory protein